MYDGSQQSASASSNGFLRTQESTYCWSGSNVTLRDRGDRRAEDSFFAGGTHVEGLPAAEEVARVALGRALTRLDAEKGPASKTTMLVDSRAAASLVSRLLGSANARSVQQGRSFWAKLVGEQAFSKVLTVADDPLIRRGLGSRHYDSEGISARVTPIVEGGVVDVSFLGTSAYVTLGLGGDPALRSTVGGKAALLGTMLHVTPAGKYQVVTDLAAHERSFNPAGGRLRPRTLRSA